MNKHPLVSIIVPVYNAEKYLPTCLDSIINQSYQNLEIILVDDGSPDNCGKICDQYAAQDSRIKVIHKENQGVSSARNQALRVLRGSVFCFIDSDDSVEKDYVSLLVQDYLSHNAPDLVFHSFKKGDTPFEFTQEKKEITLISSQDVIKDENSIFFTNGYQVSKLFKTDIIQENNIEFLSQISKYEDAIFLLQYLRYSKRVVLNPVFQYNYREVTESLSRKNLNFLQNFEIFQTFFNSVKNIYLEEEQDILNYPKLCSLLAVYVNDCILSIYTNNLSGKERKKLIKYFIPIHKEIYLKYYPNGVLNKVKKYLLKYQSTISDLLLKSYYTIRPK